MSQKHAPHGTGNEAARWLAEHGGTTCSAGKQFGCSREAVRLAWRRLYGDRPLPLAARREQLQQAVLGGGTAEHIARTTGASRSAVYKAAADMGVRLPHPRQHLPETWAAAIEAVRGGATYAEAAADFGVSEGQLADKCRELGVHSSRTSKRDGRLKRAMARVAAGESPSQAARAERTARAGVYIMQARRAAVPR